MAACAMAVRVCCSMRWKMCQAWSGRAGSPVRRCRMKMDSIASGLWLCEVSHWGIGGVSSVLVFASGQSGVTGDCSGYRQCP